MRNDMQISGIQIKLVAEVSDESGHQFCFMSKRDISSNLFVYRATMNVQQLYVQIKRLL